MAAAACAVHAGQVVTHFPDRWAVLFSPDTCGPPYLNLNGSHRHVRPSYLVCFYCIWIPPEGNVSPSRVIVSLLYLVPAELALNGDCCRVSFFPHLFMDGNFISYFVSSPHFRMFWNVFATSRNMTCNNIHFPPYIITVIFSIGCLNIMWHHISIYWREFDYNVGL